MTAVELIAAKKELRKLQKSLGKELAKGKFKDTLRIQELRREIKSKKISIGDITKNMLLQLNVEWVIL